MTLNDLLSLFSKNRPAAPLAPPDARTALGVLLVRVALADRAYLFEEIEQIDRILARQHGLNPVEAAKMRAKCEKLARGLPEDADLAAMLRDATPYDERHGLVQAMWEVMMADGVQDEHEDAIVELVEEVLGVHRDDSDAARTAAAIP